jgi:hypothetical protein
LKESEEGIMLIGKAKTNEENKFKNIILLVTMFLFLVWSTPVWFYLMALILFVSMFLRKEKPSRKEIQLNALALVGFILFVYLTDTYIFDYFF